MGPERPKGEMQPRGAEEERPAGKGVERRGAGREGAVMSIDEREEDGYSQPESSAQKGFESPEEP